MSEENNSRTNIEEDFDDGFNPDDLVNDEKNESSNINPGFVSNEVRARSFVLPIVILVFILGTPFYCWFKDTTKFKQANALFTDASTIQETIIDNRDGNLLKINNFSDGTMIFVKKNRNSNWILISENDYMGWNPTLSPDAKSVAYLSNKGNLHILIVNINLGTRKWVIPSTFDTGNSNEQSEKLHQSSICKWTDLFWSPDSSKLGFFGCLNEKSYAIIFQSNDFSIVFLELNYKENMQNRKILWSSIDEFVIISTPIESSEVQIEYGKIAK